jgi:eukaryotic-like serine/threonine-protein kinase
MVPDTNGEVTSVAPERLGRYRLVGQIGRGGMADVFLAVAAGPVGFNKLHVLKLLRQESFDNGDAARMFAIEARLAALLNHPNVVQTYEVGEDRGAVFLVMEYLEGQPLHSIVHHSKRVDAGGVLDLGMRLRILIEILDGLHYVHELRDLAEQPLNLVHRDVSPQNIFVTYDGGIKLLDFGVAKTTSNSFSTRVGTIKGKVGYMAPEQVNKPSLVSRRTDLFQVGLILWEGVVGHRVWEGLTDYEVLLRLSNYSGLDTEAPPETDPELLRICRRALAPAPESRYATAEQFASELDAFMVARKIRYTAKDVGAFVARLFAEQRQELRESIHRRLREMQGESGRGGRQADAALPPLFSGLLGGQTSSSHLNVPGGGRMFSSTVARRFDQGESPTMVKGDSAKSGRARGWKVAAATTAVGAVAVLGAVAAQKGTTLSARSSVVAPNSAVEVKSGLAEFSVEAVPSDARLFLDNAPLPSNPFRRAVGKDAALHMVRAEAAGYETVSILVRFDRDTENIIALRPTKASAEPATIPSARAPSVSKESRGHPSKASAAGRPKPSVAESAIPTSNPKSAPAGKSPPAVKLDDSDPWQK